MAVSTPLQREPLQAFVSDHGLGALRDYRGIAAGVENTNYVVTTAAGAFVLTLFERAAPRDLPYALALTRFLAERGLPCPQPVAGPGGELLGALAGRPAALLRRLPGRSIAEPGPAHCRAVGTLLGRLHVQAAAFPQRRANGRGPRWWREAAESVQPRLDAEARALLRKELHFQSLFRFADLPAGVIHADLFRHNVLFEGDTLSGVLDFYCACDDALLFDLAITVNDWCSDADGALDGARSDALLVAYREQRPFAAIERGAWPVMLRAAALRFWLSRLQDPGRPGAAPGTAKDPTAFRRILERRIGVRHDLPV